MSAKVDSWIQGRAALRTWPGCQTWSRLSLPPDASCPPEGLHLRPHTSCWCPVSRSFTWSRSLCKAMVKDMLLYASTQITNVAGQATYKSCLLSCQPPESPTDESSSHWLAIGWPKR